MKIVKTPSLVLLAAIAALSSSTVFAAARNLPVAEDFLNFAGTAVGDLPGGFQVEADTTFVWNGKGNGTTTGKGFWSLGNTAGDSDRALGVLETSTFGDTRILVEVKNAGATPVTRLRVRYNVEEWRDGARVSQIKLKYNPDAGTEGTIPGGFSDLPELVVTNAPVTNNNDTALDGNVAGKVAVDYTIVLAEPLATSGDDARGWVRWQHSSTGSGTRDKIGVDDIQIDDATLVGTNKSWVGGSGTWNPTGGTSWSGGAWNNAGNYDAVLGGTAGTLTLGGDVTAVNIEATSNGYVITGSNTVTVNGVVSVDDGTASDIVATISAPLATPSGLIKTGPDTLVLTTAQAYSGTTSVAQGTLALSGASAALPSASALFVSDGATFDLGGGFYTRVVGGLGGGATAVVETTDNTLEINTAGVASFKGDVTGTGNVVKKGAGSQKFRNQVKTYSGSTTVENGIFEVTENGSLTNTSSVTVTGAAAELRLSTDDPLGSVYTFGTSGSVALTLASGGSLASETDDIVTVVNDLVIGTGGGFIYARGTAAGVKVTLNGSLTGSGKLSRQGQAEVVINGNGSAFTGDVDLNNGLTTINSGKTLGDGTIDVKVQGANSTEKASLRGAGTVGGNLTYAANSQVDLSKLSGTTVVTGNLDLGTATILTSGVGSGTYNLFSVSGTKSYGSVTITGGGTLSTSGNIVRLIK